MTHATRFMKLALLLIAAGTLALAGCGGDDNGVRVETVEVPADPEIVEVEVEVPDASGLEGVQEMATNAATAAKMAADAAKMASDEAAAATMNLATMQTGAMSAMHAYNAKKYADMAMAEYMKAKTASEAAAVATTTTAATTERDKAEAAQMAAEDAAMMVANEEMTGYADKAKAAATMELMIDGTMKSVGDTTIDAMAGASSVTTGAGADAQTVITGLIESKNPMATGDEIAGAAYVPAGMDDLTTEAIEPTTAAVPYMQAAAERTFAIGKTLDSDDDMARLMLVTHYAGTDMVNVFAPADNSAQRSGTNPGFISINRTTGTVSTEAADANNTPLRSLGMFYPAGDEAAAPELVFGNVIADNAEPVEVFQYTWTTDADPPVTTTVYATLATTSTDAATGDATYTYNTGADIVADAAAPDGPDDAGALDEARVNVGIPAAVAYQHLHFGVWASLGDAASDGSQMVDGLGIGFVQNFSGMGMTAAMPNKEMLTYSGNWAATIQSAAGRTVLESGAADLTANLGKATLEADLDGLAMLEGALSGSMFSGMKATVDAANTLGLNAGGEFTGEFSGGFYGDDAVEAGGTFDFSSTSGGAFTGAFGGRMEK